MLVWGMSEFAKNLKFWRKLRRYSQLELAFEADISGRHLSFLENGRAKPSRDMVLRLCTALQVPLEVSNQFLTQAGFAAKYGQHQWTDADMAPIAQAVQTTLTNHMPYAGLALDSLWRIVNANKTAQTLFAGFGIGIGSSLLDFMMSDGLPDIVENWPEVAQAAATRCRIESLAKGGVPELDKAAEYLAKFGVLSDRAKSPVIPTIISTSGARLSMFATIAQIGTPEDLALDDFKIELYYPMDEVTENAFEIMSAV